MSIKSISKKVLTIAWCILGLWLVVGTIVFIVYPASVANKAFQNSHYGKRIYAMEFRKGHRGSPHLKFDSGWYLLKIEEMKIVPYIQVGDSIVKESGSDMISVYRTKDDGYMYVKKFE